ncbi:MAG: S1C family serine protease, partial [Rhizobiaceae bacterium]
VLPVRAPDAERSDEPEGSGVVMGDGTLVATANHVIAAAKEVFVRTVLGEIIKADIVLREPQTDIALLRVHSKLKPVALGQTSVLASRACAIGNSFGLGISVSCGVVSATQMSGVGFNRIEDFVQTDAAVNPGMSGGALVNGDGRLIGMLSAIFTKTSDADIGVNFAVSTMLLIRIMDEFSETGTVSLLQPGLVVRPALRAGMPGTQGALVVQVKDGSPEAQAGLIAGDVILFANGRRIKRAGAYMAALAHLRKGDSLALDILREGTRKAVAIRFE